MLCNLRYAYFNTPGKGGKLVFVFSNFVKNIEKYPSYRMIKNSAILPAILQISPDCVCKVSGSF